ncbi:hypothetical protein JW930_04375 [Candidatus Woesearchaeota archaeon]|nr:hypothetical protein [Candidatus Woesearchaeota archaeon]
MTVNYAVPYFQSFQDYGFVVLIDRRRGWTKKIGEDSLNPKTTLVSLPGDLASKVYLEGGRLATLIGTYGIHAEETSAVPPDVASQIIRAILHYQIDQLPFTLAKETDLGIFVFTLRPGNKDVLLEHVRYSEELSIRSTLSAVTPERLARSVFFQNGDSPYVVIGSESYPNIKEAVDLLTEVERMMGCDATDTEVYEIYVVSIEGIHQIYASNLQDQNPGYLWLRMQHEKPWRKGRNLQGTPCTLDVITKREFDRVRRLKDDAVGALPLGVHPCEAVYFYCENLDRLMTPDDVAEILGTAHVLIDEYGKPIITLLASHAELGTRTVDRTREGLPPFIRVKDGSLRYPINGKVKPRKIKQRKSQAKS